MFAFSVQRFYTRYTAGTTTTPNKTYYDKLISNNQFTKQLFVAMQGIIGLNKTSTDTSDNRTLSYGQYSNCKRDTDTITDEPSTRLLKEPKPRADRCISAYNPKTEELVVQFLPILEDRFAFRNNFPNGIPTDGLAEHRETIPTMVLRQTPRAQHFHKPKCQPVTRLQTSYLYDVP